MVGYETILSNLFHWLIASDTLRLLDDPIHMTIPTQIMKEGMTNTPKKNP